MTRSMALVVMTLLLAGVAAGQDFADYYYLPPETPEGEGSAEGEALAAKSDLAGNVLSAALQHTHPVYAFRGFEGQKSALDLEGQDYPALRVAAEYPVDLSGDTLFDDGVVKGGERYFVAEIVSSEAYAIRLCVDLSSLAPEDAVWMVSPAVERAFGPYTSRDAFAGRLWLPTVSGDTALLVVQQAKGTDRPGLRIESLAHFYVDMTKAVYPCPIHAACEENATFQEVSTGVGRLLIPVRSQGMFLCSGALLNVPETAELEPLMISAHHCFDGQVDVPGIEVFWDYRAENCDGTGVPELDSPSVPRSRGTAILAEDTCLDTELFQIDAIPNGHWGRAWLGWDARTPVTGDLVAGAHYPGGSELKTCVGDVEAVDIQACLNILCTKPVYHQVRVQWDHGITEQGSSGSPAMYRQFGYRVLGMLSNGPTHDCDNPPQNVDDFASFARFYPEIKCYLRPGNECAEPESCRNRLCPLKVAIGAESATLQNLRVFRDKVLMPTAWGRMLAATYYRQAPEMVRALQTHPEFKPVLAMAAGPAAALGAWLK